MNDVIAPAPATLQFTRRYPFPRERIFRAWTEPEALKAWFGPTDTFKAPIVEVDLRVGGRYRIVMVAPDGTERQGGGVYVEVSPPAKLAFTWAWGFTGGKESLVTVELRDRDGDTELVLTHEGLAEAVREAHLQGWIGGLERLGRLCP